MKKAIQQERTLTANKKGSYGKMLLRDFRNYKVIYALLLPGLLYFIIFCYIPMYGVVISFKDFSPALGIFGSPWVGLEHFKEFFGSYYFWRLLRNTLLLSVYCILWGFPLPIIFALFLNEIGSSKFKKVVQTATYLPHFISAVVVVGLLVNFVSLQGLVNDIIAMFGGERRNMLMDPGMFRGLYVFLDVWQGFGWSSIIYLAAITSIDSELYDAATVDGAGRFRKMISVTLPGILPTIIVLLILRMGSLLSVGHEKVLLMYNASTYETADIISTFVYRTGLVQGEYSYSTAVGLFQSIVNFILIVAVNKISAKVDQGSLW